jgi:hypothetical protein
VTNYGTLSRLRVERQVPPHHQAHGEERRDWRRWSGWTSSRSVTLDIYSHPLLDTQEKATKALEEALR